MTGAAITQPANAQEGEKNETRMSDSFNMKAQ
jgi:hypothetical protein